MSPVYFYTADFILFYFILFLFLKTTCMYECQKQRSSTVIIAPNLNLTTYNSVIARFEPDTIIEQAYLLHMLEYQLLIPSYIIDIQNIYTSMHCYISVSVLHNIYDDFQYWET
jgi:hypothetical protein